MVFSPTQAHRIAEAGFTKEEVRFELWQQGRIPLAHLSETEDKVIREWRQRSIVIDNGREYLHPTHSHEDIAVLVAGGEGPHSAVIPTFNGSRLVSLEI